MTTQDIITYTYNIKDYSNKHHYYRFNKMINIDKKVTTKDNNVNHEYLFGDYQPNRIIEITPGIPKNIMFVLYASDTIIILVDNLGKYYVNIGKKMIVTNEYVVIDGQCIRIINGLSSNTFGHINNTWLLNDTTLLVLYGNGDHILYTRMA